MPQAVSGTIQRQAGARPHLRDKVQVPAIGQLPERDYSPPDSLPSEARTATLCVRSPYLKITVRLLICHSTSPKHGPFREHHKLEMDTSYEVRVRMRYAWC